MMNDALLVDNPIGFEKDLQRQKRAFVYIYSKEMFAIGSQG